MKALWILRNKLLHGYHALTAEELSPSYEKMRKITLGTIACIQDENTKAKLTHEFQTLYANAIHEHD